MKKFLTVLILVLSLGVGLTSELAASDPVGKSENSAFYNISLTTAKQMAQQQGKYIFIEFYADWCVPCKWMEETTFSDPDVQKKLSQDFIALKVDIDDFDGFALKEHYEIRVLPTLLILDQNGRTVERKEQSYTPSMMMELLEEKVVSKNTVEVNTSPIKANINKDEIGEAKGKIIDKIKDIEPTVNHATVKTTSYRVQVGVFTDYANTDSMVAELRSLCDEPIVVLNDYLNDRVVFKVLIGDCETKKEATDLKKLLYQNYGIDGFVK